MEYGSDYVVVLGRGLSRLNGEWHMSVGTQRRVEAALEYIDEHPVGGLFLLGGHSKWDPTPPGGITDAGLMRADIQGELDPGTPIYTDEGMRSTDTFDNAINLAQLVRTHGVRLEDDDRLLFVSGANHYSRISLLSSLAIGLSDEVTGLAFDRIHVDEDSVRGAAKEAVGRLLLKSLLSDITPGDTDEMRKAQDIMNDWLNHKTSIRTICQIVQAMGLHTLSLYSAALPRGYFSSPYEH